MDYILAFHRPICRLLGGDDGRAIFEDSKPVGKFGEGCFWGLASRFHAKHSRPTVAAVMPYLKPGFRSSVGQECPDYGELRNPWLSECHSGQESILG